MSGLWTDKFAPDKDSSDSYRSVIETFLNVDWSAMPMGPLENWDHSFRSTVCQVFKTRSTFAALFLGEDLNVVYNAAALGFYRDRHPFMMGKPYHIAWADLDIFEEAMAQIRDVQKTGMSIQCGVSPMHFHRNPGQVQEQFYCSWEVIPIMDDQQQYTSSLLHLENHTRSIREQQRSIFLAKLHEKLVNVQDFQTIYKECNDVLSGSTSQIPWLHMYSLDDTTGLFSLVVKHESSEEYAAAIFKHERQVEELLRKAVTSLEPLWHTLTLDGAQLELLIYPPVQDTDLAFSRHVLLGRNPRREMNDTSRYFVGSCASTITSALGAISSTAMLKRSERRFQEMLLKAPIGFNVEDEKTRLPTFVNSAWRELCDFYLELDQITPDADFGVLLHDSNREPFMKDYAAVNKDRPMLNREVRLKRRFYPRNVAALNVLSMFKAELSVKRIDLQCDIADTGYVLTDGSRFFQILINMITNALKFAPQDGTGHIHVSLSIRQQATNRNPNQVRIDCSVKDNGPGSGLSLYISKQLTELLGGKIQASSTPGLGATLSFYVLGTRAEEILMKSPLLGNGHMETDSSQMPRVAKMLTSRILRSATNTSTKADRKTLLIVEDNLVNQQLMSKLLSSTYSILTANNGLECLQLMQSNLGHKVELVLCDIEMPVMNGYQAVRQVKEWQRSQGMQPIQFLAVSANARPEQVQKMLDAGMDNTIGKPFGRQEILSVVKQMLDSKS